ncbi:MAG: response regulator [Candidatus Omnitrophota bacterium]
MSNTKTVVIVEDDRDINDLIAYNLRKEGYYVEQFYDGLSGLERLKSQISDIVILDIMLPGIDGYDICKEIKGDAAGNLTFIIVVSAKSHEQDKLYAHLLGADCYLTKPFNLASLMAAVGEVSVNLDKQYSVRVC